MKYHIQFMIARVDPKGMIEFYQDGGTYFEDKWQSTDYDTFETVSAAESHASTKNLDDFFILPKYTLTRRTEK